MSEGREVEVRGEEPRAQGAGAGSPLEPRPEVSGAILVSDRPRTSPSSIESAATPSARRLHPLVHARFDVRRCLGSGTFGVVYEARERGSGAPVALKKLAIADPGAVYAFKQEFRALADVVHANLVRLDELFSIGDELYLLMELVDGVSFLEAVHASRGASPGSSVRADAPTAAFDTAHASTLGSDPDASSSPEGPTSGPRRRPATTDVPRLRAALPELARGVLAIHRAGKLHRDLKPSNVLVTATGRIVILDFGLVAPPGRRREHRVVGTPAYMSPEQAQGIALGPASDWYAVGVMLFEALTGELPIEGDARTIMVRKQSVDAPDPRERAEGVPDDLAELCTRLLARDPRERPTGADVLRALGAEDHDAARVALEGAPLVGRDHHLAALEAALAATRARRGVTTLVHGVSGMGKSALCRRFLDGLAARGVLVLQGRCHERELVPYKALDAVVDALADYLAGLPRAELDALLPADMFALSTLFPALRRLPGALAEGSAEGLDPVEERRRAAIALRRLLGALGERETLVVAIDDLQWGDADSASLLLDVLSPPDPPPMLLVALYRSEDAASVHLAAALHRRMARGEPVGDVRELWVGPLGEREVRALARALLPDDAATAAIAREAGGSPLLVRELARHATGRGDGLDAASISLEDVLRRRIDALAVEPRRLLEAIAVAGRPIAVAAVERAASVTDVGALATLRAESLIKIGGMGGGRAAEVFHARIRDAVLARLSAAVRARTSLALALALEASGSSDPESLLVYFEAGGDAARARAFAEAAAARADDALAFDRAAALYRRALDRAPNRGQLRIKLAHALAHAGRGAEAGRAYLDAAVDAEPATALDLRRRAAEQFLRAGHVDEGTAAVRDVLATVGLALPETPARAFASLVYRRARLALRGLAHDEPRASSRPEDLTRMDVCWSVAHGLNGVDVVRSADFQARYLQYALESGEPSRIALALASEAIFVAMEGGAATAARAAELSDRARALAERAADPRAVAWAEGAVASVAFYEQRFGACADQADRAIAMFRETRGDIVWELGSLVGWMLLPSLWFMGAIEGVRRRLPAHLKEAEDLGALYNLTSLRTLMVPRIRLTEDRPIEALRESEDAIRGWSRQHGMTAQHCCDLYTRAHGALYLGDGPAARDAMERSDRALARSLLLRVESVRLDVVYLRGSTAVAAAPRGAEGAALLGAAERDARALARERAPYAHAFASALSAAIAAERGQLDRAVNAYADAARRFQDLGMKLHAAVMQRRRGEMILGDEGRALTDGADAFLRGQGVVRPDRIVAMLAPLRTA